MLDLADAFSAIMLSMFSEKCVDPENVRTKVFSHTMLKTHAYTNAWTGATHMEGSRSRIALTSDKKNCMKIKREKLNHRIVVATASGTGGQNLPLIYTNATHDGRERYGIFFIDTKIASWLIRFFFQTRN